MRFDQGEQENGGMSVRLIFLTHSAALNIFLHILHETWPSEVGGNKLTGFKVSWVAGGLVIMVTGKDGVIEDVIRGNVDVAFIHR